MKIQQIQTNLKIQDEQDLRNALEILGAIQGDEVPVEVDLGRGKLKTVALLQKLQQEEGTLTHNATLLLEQATSGDRHSQGGNGNGLLQQVYTKIEDQVDVMARQAAIRQADMFGGKVLAHLTGSVRSEETGVESMAFLGQLEKMAEGVTSDPYSPNGVTTYQSLAPQSQQNQKQLPSSPK
jgi:hypothetical protein